MSMELPPDAETDLLPLLRECEARIEYQFRDKNLLRASLNARLRRNAPAGFQRAFGIPGRCNSGAVVCELLFRQYPEFLEGDLTRLKSIVVSRQTCAKISQSLGMHEFLILGKGMTTHPTVPVSLLADVFESLIAAIYLDGGDSAAREFIERHLDPEIALAADDDSGSNYKSVLQQVAQREHGTTPTYQLLDEKGPDHSKCFKISAQIGTASLPAGLGRNKKEAEQRTAKNALHELKGKPPPFPFD